MSAPQTEIKDPSIVPAGDPHGARTVWVFGGLKHGYGETWLVVSVPV